MPGGTSPDPAASPAPSAPMCDNGVVGVQDS
eukprot:CAMPEP_0177556636 /NCGR_PEP_ID=MMETSP0369-20130122/69183_1 /TAXON_ID=447022 ORGANISM="Scrippsiella hangoei-like, Strain SHHI-4" /NCGR_SAMPLE_ID=MMETSP0369 /ASSEMBLY_ACC=CAM_ASM_000364 /LENGTH=30 /DNA_ID= /DNA_START= /DNA_END= /DNA_ORIENTATION=